VDIRAAYTADPTGTAGEIVDALLAVSPEFAAVWRRHEVDVTHHQDLKRYRHPELGELELYGQRLVDPDEGQELLIFSAQPGSPSDEKLQRLITMS
jgi:MmyB-like transcription regulator ligand binding domain